MIKQVDPNEKTGPYSLLLLPTKLSSAQMTSGLGDKKLSQLRTGIDVGHNWQFGMQLTMANRI